MTRSIWIGVLAAASGCASVSPKPSFDEVQTLVDERSGHRIRWQEGSAADQQVDREVQALLDKALTPDEAVEIALLRNPSLQAIYEDLGVAQADLVQAGLLKNPVLFASARFPLSPASLVDFSVSITQEFLDLFLMPARKRMAGAQLAQAKLRVGDAVLEMSADVRSAYFNAVAAAQTALLRKAILTTAQASAELATRQKEAGNVADLRLAVEQVFAGEARMALVRAENEAVVARERLVRLMGLSAEASRIKLPDSLSEIPATEPDLSQLETVAMAQRLDLQAANQEWIAMGEALSLTKTSRWTGTAQLGVSAERDAEGKTVVGPTIGLELPIFDQGQAKVARVEAQWRQSRLRAAQLELAVRSEVRTSRANLESARRVLATFKTELLPLRERIVKLSQQRYNAMLLGVYQLLVSKQAEVEGYAGYVDALRSYWVARSDLERAVGGRLPSAALTPAAALTIPVPN